MAGIPICHADVWYCNELPGFDENLGFLEGVEDLSVQEFDAQPRVEALYVTVLSGRTQADEGGPRPGLHRHGYAKLNKRPSYC